MIMICLPVCNLNYFDFDNIIYILIVLDSLLD
jgi:hypothetical protein